MNIVPAESIIISQWEQFFGFGRQFSYREDLALMFTVEISVDNHGYEKDGNTHRPEWQRSFYRLIDIVVTGRHNVFVRSGEAQYGRDRVQWENPSNHDTCWRTDGLRIIWETCCAAWEHCWRHVPDEHQRSMEQMNTHCRVNDHLFCADCIRLVSVKTKYSGNGRRELESVTPVDLKFTIA